MSKYLNKTTVIYLFIGLLFVSCGTEKNPVSADEKIPIPPTTLESVVISPTSLILSWVDNSDNESGFVIERKIGDNNFSLLVTTQANEISYREENLNTQEIYTYRVHAVNSTYDSGEFSNSSTSTAGQFVDIRDEQIYTVIQIGSQVWMEKNINFQIDGATYYNNDSQTYSNYGLLYKWNEAMNAAPIGWHLPSYDELQSLFTYLGGIDVAGNKLKGTGNTYWRQYNSEATNASGFNALPGGYWRSTEDGAFSGYEGVGDFGEFWSSSESGTESAYSFNLNSFNGTASNLIHSKNYTKSSLRVIHD